MSQAITIRIARPARSRMHHVTQDRIAARQARFSAAAEKTAPCDSVIGELPHTRERYLYPRVCLIVRGVTIRASSLSEWTFLIHSIYLVALENIPALSTVVATGRRAQQIAEKLARPSTRSGVIIEAEMVPLPGRGTRCIDATDGLSRRDVAMPVPYIGVAHRDAGDASEPHVSGADSCRGWWVICSICPLAPRRWRRSGWWKRFWGPVGQVRLGNLLFPETNLRLPCGPSGVRSRRSPVRGFRWCWPQ